MPPLWTPSDRIAIVGAGISGTVLAARLLRAGVDVALIDRLDHGPGLAYGAAGGHHRLNVRSARMSAFPEDPDHFVDWVARKGQWRAAPDLFLPRGVYGLYLRDVLAGAERAGPGRLERVIGEAFDLEPDGVRLADGRLIAAGRVVVATGNEAPARAPKAAGVVADPWAPRALDHLGQDDDVVILGSGLTMVDVVLELLDRDWHGVATVLSRRGLLPRAHGEGDIRVLPRQPASGALSRRLEDFRRRARLIGWRPAMEEMRGRNADLWAELTLAERQRFLRHLRPWWDVHRHLMAPEIAARIRRLEQDGRLRVRAGHFLDAVSNDGGVKVLFRPRGNHDHHRVRGALLIDCTGPAPLQSDANPFIHALVQQGLAQLDKLGLGLETDRHGGLLAADGAPSGRLFALGPPTRGMHWEITAVPDIRQRARDLAERLAQSTAVPAVRTASRR